MNKILLLLLILPYTLYTYSNVPEGSYKNKSDSICFSDGKLIFCLSGYGALSTNIVGEGTYEIKDKYLLINTEEYSGTKSSINSEPTEADKTVSISMLNKEGYPQSGVLVEFISASNKTIDRAISDDNGKVEKPYNDKISSVRVSMMGYNGLSFKYDNSLDYTIELVKNKVLENQAILFELKVDDEDSITLTLLSEDFKAGKDLNGSLDKAYKRAKKTNNLGKKYKKEYVSVFYNR